MFEPQSNPLGGATFWVGSGILFYKGENWGLEGYVLLKSQQKG